MSNIIIELTVLLLLLLANGVFATAEMAFVCVKKSRLETRAAKGDERADVALRLIASPTRFLSTVQVGITLVGIVAGVFGGACLARELAIVFSKVSWLAPHANGLSFGVVVFGIAFCSLVIGELVPKRLALHQPERITLLLARPMHWLSVAIGPAVALLSATTDAVFRCFGVRQAAEPSITDEEVKMLIKEGHHAGVFHPSEIEMVESVMQLDEQTVAALMTPLNRIVALRLNDPEEVTWRKIVSSGHTYFPVCESEPDFPIGVISVKGMWANLAAGAPIRLRDLAMPMLTVPGAMSATDLVATFKKAGQHLALVRGAHGRIEGLITATDLLEAIVGYLPKDELRRRNSCRQRADGSWLVDATMDFAELERTLGSTSRLPKEPGVYRSVGGFALEQLGRTPHEGDSFEWQGWLFEIIDMDRRRIDKLAVARNFEPV